MISVFAGIVTVFGLSGLAVPGYPVGRTAPEEILLRCIVGVPVGTGVLVTIASVFGRRTKELFAGIPYFDRMSDVRAAFASYPVSRGWKDRPWARSSDGLIDMAWGLGLAAILYVIAHVMIYTVFTST